MARRDGMSLRAVVLGAAAGGGLPQWNCGCAMCRAARDPASPVRPQTQSSLAVSVDGAHWALLNASPDIREQLGARPELHPRALRDSPIASVLLTNGDVDHLIGLIGLREGHAFTLYATPRIQQIVARNPVFGVLDPARVTPVSVVLDQPFDLLPGLTATLFAVPGKAALWLEGEAGTGHREGEDTIGVHLSDGSRAMFYIPGCARLTPALADRLRGAALVLFDGTVFHDDEMVRTGTSPKTGARMGHMAMAGPEGSLAAFEGLGVRRRVYVHINNTNPVWNPASPERAAVEAAGWEVGFDGMELAPDGAPVRQAMEETSA